MPSSRDVMLGGAVFLLSGDAVLMRSRRSRVRVSLVCSQTGSFHYDCVIGGPRCLHVCDCCVLSACLGFFVSLCRRSTSPPGGNQVDGLPPALSRFGPRGVFNREFLEICEFVWPNRVLCTVFLGHGFRLVVPNRQTNSKRSR